MDEMFFAPINIRLKKFSYRPGGKMRKHINNPHKVNWKMYSFIGLISVLIMIVGVIWYDCTKSIASDILKNLAFGCVASTLVALLIDIGNIREKNEKINNVYDSVYQELQFCIMRYIETWSNLCCVAYEDGNYRQEKHTWTEWYEITKSEFAQCDENRQDELIRFFGEELLYGVEKIEKAIKQIEDQQYVLNINDVCDDGLKNILSDFSFEFYAAKLTLKRDSDKKDFWRSFDAIEQDLVKYIYNWVDIRYYNYCRFKPYKFFEDKTELKRAIVESEQKSKEI